MAEGRHTRRYERRHRHTWAEKRVNEGRLSAKWAPTDNLTWTGRADYALTTGDGVNPKRPELVPLGAVVTLSERGSAS